MDKTSRLGLNLPDKGFRDWDVPINENFSLIDSKVAGLGLNNVFTGTNTFNSSMFMQSGNDMSFVIKSINADNTLQTQEVTTLGNFRTVDKNGKIIGDIRFARGTNGTVTSSMIARNYASNADGINAAITCSVDKNGNILTAAPTPADNSNGASIATTSWVRRLFALLTGNNTFSGTNTFHSVYTYLKGKVIDVTNAPTTQADVGIEFQDKNGTAIGQNHVRTYTNGNISHNMYVKNPNSNTWAAISIGFNADGTLFTAAPTPATANNSTNIATTAFVKAQIQEVTAAPSSSVSGVLYVIPE